MRQKKYANRDLIIYCDRASASARTIARVLGCRRWFEYSTPGRKTATVVPVVINWGASDPPLWIQPKHWPWPNSPKHHILNDVSNVSTAINKLSTLEALKNANVPCLDFVIFPEARVPESQRTVLNDWLEADGRYIARRTLTGSSGSGLRVVTKTEEHIAAPLYTRYYAKTHEFRVHVWKGEVIDFTQKRLRPELVGNAERLVRSLENGWTHAHILEPFCQAARAEIERVAVAACAAVSLDFGAVDILARFSSKSNRPLKDCRVCEINTAPGLENSATIEAYTNAVDRHYTAIKKRPIVRPVG